MKFIALVLAVLLAAVPLTAFASGERTVVSLDNKDIVYMGRWEKEDDGLMHGSFECGLVLRFTGTGISLSGSASGAALIAIDGGKVKTKKLSKDASLFSGLQAGEHTLELYSESQKSFPVIGGFTLDPGAHTLPSPDGGFIEFIGDSITAGYVAANDARSGNNDSYAYSYAFLTGRKLLQDRGMRFNTVAVSGIRLTERGDNTEGEDPLGMPERYFLNREYKSKVKMETERAATHRWDTAAYTPDIIVINLGTNDYFNEDKDVVEAAVSFLRDLRASYCDALIFVMTPFIGFKREAVIEAVNTAGDEKTILVDTKEWEIKAGSDWIHPAPREHERVMKLLLEVLTPYLEAMPEPVTTETPAEEPTEAPTEVPTEKLTDAPTETPVETEETEKTPENNGQSVWLYIAGGVLLIAVSAGIALFVTRKKK